MTIDRGRRRFVLPIALLCAALVTVGFPSPATAHDYGPFAIDRYAGILVSPDGIVVDYVVDLAETPTQAEGDTVEADPAAWCAERLVDITVTVDGAPVTLHAVSAVADRRPGDGGLTTMRVECGWSAPIDPADSRRRMVVTDRNDTGRVGWREIVVVGNLVAIEGDVTDETITARLTDFPDADQNTRTTEVAFDFVASDEVGPGELDDTRPDDDDDDRDLLGGLITDADTGWSMALALGIAAVLGSLHALAPGHGKTVIGAYLVGTRGTKIQALVLAIAVALSHTLGVLVLGIITVAAGAAFAPENVYPWLQALSATIVLGIGVWLVWSAWREFRERRLPLAGKGHTHDREHHHDHDTGTAWHRHGIFPHTHRFDIDEMDLHGKISWKTLALLGLTGGLVPSTAAIIVLLGAIQLNRLAFGGLLILAFGIGMSIALVSVGLGMVALRDRVFGAMDGNEMIRRARVLIVPVAAAAVLAIGIFLVTRAFVGLDRI